MRISIYAIVNSEGFISAFVNAQMLPEIVDQPNAVPAPHEDVPLEIGKAWRRVADAWIQVPDPMLR